MYFSTIFTRLFFGSKMLHTNHFYTIVFYCQKYSNFFSLSDFKIKTKFTEEPYADVNHWHASPRVEATLNTIVTKLFGVVQGTCPNNFQQHPTTSEHQNQPILVHQNANAKMRKNWHNNNGINNSINNDTNKHVTTLSTFSNSTTCTTHQQFVYLQHFLKRAAPSTLFERTT